MANLHKLGGAWAISELHKSSLLMQLRTNITRAQKGDVSLKSEIDQMRKEHEAATKPKFVTIAKCAPDKKNPNGGYKKRKFMADGEDGDMYEMEVLQSAYSGDLIGVVAIKGVIQKDSDWCSKGTAQTRKELQMMGQNPQVKGVLLVVDSPGGEVAGTMDLAKDVRDFETNYGKPITAYVSDAAYSAAYWIASQAREVVLSSETAGVGSIGTMVTLLDDSAMLEEQGLREIVVKATASTDKNAAYEQALEGNTVKLRRDMLDPINRVFTNAVTSARPNLDTDPEGVLAGNTFVGQNAIRVGLADRIGTMQEAFDALLVLCDSCASEDEYPIFDSQSAQPRFQAKETANHQQPIIQSQNSIKSMNLLKSMLQSALGIFGIKQTPENLEKLEQTTATFEADIQAYEEKVAQLAAQAAQQSVIETTQKIADLNAKIETIEKALAEGEKSQIEAANKTQEESKKGFEAKLQAMQEAHEAQIEALAARIDEMAKTIGVKSLAKANTQPAPKTDGNLLPVETFDVESDPNFQKIVAKTRKEYADMNLPAEKAEAEIERQKAVYIQKHASLAK